MFDLAVIVQWLGHCVVGAITQVRILVTAIFFFFFLTEFPQFLEAKKVSSLDAKCPD